MNQSFLIIGHRGAPALAPENTLPSFSRAIEAGVQGIELDVHRVDSQLVVIHDDTVDRTSNGAGTLQSFSFESLRNLDFGGGEIIPTLVEVIAATPSVVFINVELKGLNTGREVARILVDYPRHQFMVSSFHPVELQEFIETFGIQSNTEIALLGIRLTKRLSATALQLGAKFVNVSSRFLKTKHVVQASEQGLQVLVYTVNTLKSAKKYKDMGAAGIFTDNPATIRTSLLT